jgi:predicted CoA-binding protein
MTFTRKRIAVIGVSLSSDKYGNKVFCGMVQAGWDVYGVNPKGGEVADQTLYQSLSEVPQPVDIVVTVVPPAITLQVVEDCHKLGIHTIWMQPGSESDEAVTRAKELGMQVTSNACIMVKSGLW